MDICCPLRLNPPLFSWRVFYLGTRAASDGLCLFTKRLERGRFVWSVTRDGKVHLTPAQLSMLPEGINWKHPKRTEHAGIRI
ncbi:hypothetical protein GJ336_03985 [Escherichia coli]|nr:hypothetical protein [Escherichia coli]